MAGPKAGFTADELRSLGESVGEGDEVEETTAEETTETETEAAETTQAETATEAEVKPGDSKPNGKGKGDLNVALHEEREKRREVEQRMARMEGAFEHFVKQNNNQPRQNTQQQQKSEELPDYNVDPIGHLNARIALQDKQMQAIMGERQQRQAQEQQMEGANQMLNRYAANVKEFASTTPDYNAAYEHLAKSRDEELKTLGFSDPVERTNRMQYEEGLIVGRALMANQNPAKILYQAAQLRGYSNAPAKAADSKIVTLAKGAQAAKTLSTSKGGVDSGEMSLERLSELMDEDPKQADQMWDRMKRKGMLG